jgi:hypothetical protein
MGCGGKALTPDTAVINGSKSLTRNAAAALAAVVFDCSGRDVKYNNQLVTVRASVDEWTLPPHTTATDGHVGAAPKIMCTSAMIIKGR